MKNQTKKSNVSWIEYDIHWDKLAKTNCKKCHGRGYEGYEYLPEKEEKAMLKKNPNWKPALLLCSCVEKRWLKMKDEERLQYATKKANAEEIKQQAQEMIKKLAQEEAEKEGIELEK